MQTRINAIGIVFRIIEITPETTKVDNGKNSIIVKMSSVDFINCWYRWQMLGEFIQDAFRNIPADQRDFLLKGDSFKTETKVSSKKIK
jgi:hypothetical protein